MLQKFDRMRVIMTQITAAYIILLLDAPPVLTSINVHVTYLNASLVKLGVCSEFFGGCGSPLLPGPTA